ncbi:MAG: threonine--tRNA ligase [Thermoprotei archaeon]
MLVERAVSNFRRVVPLVCGVLDQGFYCDFIAEEWLKEEDAMRIEKWVNDNGFSVIVNTLKPEEENNLKRNRSKVFEIYGNVKVSALSVNGYSSLLKGSWNFGSFPQQVVVKITNISAHNPSPDVRLLRVSGIAFGSKEELDNYLKYSEELVKRDHRVLGRKLDLYSFHEDAGVGLVLFHPKGTIIRQELINLMREVNRNLNYMEVSTPHVYRVELWKMSGHYEYYRDRMIIFDVKDEKYGVKPMNCPGHILIYKSSLKSYRDLPFKLSEFGTVYRWEQEGELYGLLRLRGFTQDDGHAFLREDQVKDEVKNILNEVTRILSLFGFKKDDVKISLSTRPAHSIGTDEQWRKAEKALKEALYEIRMDYEVKEGEGAFYGPKIDVDFRDNLGRWWQCSTIQVDFALPERFDIYYIDQDNKPKRPVMVHRAILGSIERFMAIIIENFSGRLPTWLSPIQVTVIPITNAQNEYAMKITQLLESKNIRATVDLSPDTLNKKIKNAYDQSIPYIIIVGKKEAETGKISIRARGGKEAKDIELNTFIELLSNEISTRSLTQYTIDSLIKI